MVDLKELIKAGVHFGHQTWRWNPKMKPYIWGSKNGVHLIDVSKTAFLLDKAARFLEETAASGRPILFVGTKKAARQPIIDAAQKFNIPFVTHRWIGGTLTNHSQVKKSITKLLHYEDILSKSDQHSYTKKELGIFRKTVERSEKNIGGIKKLVWPIGALFVVDVKKEYTAVREAVAAGVPVVGIVDTNCDPSFITHVIPANDDIARAIEIIVNNLAEAVARGQAVAAARPQEAASLEEAENLLDRDLREKEGEEERRPGSRRRRPARGGRGGDRSGRPGQSSAPRENQ